MLSLVVTALLVGLVASDPVLPGGNQVKVITAPKVHREQVGLIHQEAVPVPETRVVTNERVKVVTQKKHVLVPKIHVQKILQQVPLQTIKKVAAPVVMKHKEIVPMIQTKVNTVVKKVPKIITKTLIRNIPRIKEVPRIHTKHVHHVQTKMVPKAVPQPYQVDNPVAVPKHVVHKSPVPMEVVRPKYIDRVHVKTQTKVVDRPVIRNVVHEKPMIQTQIKTVHKNVPVPHFVPKHIHHTKVVNRVVPKIQTVYQQQPVPKIIKQTHVKEVKVPFVQTQTVVKNNNVPIGIPKYIDRVQTVKQNVPVKIPFIKREKVPVHHKEIIPHVVTRIQPKIEVRDRVHTVHKTHIKPVPHIVKQLIPQVKIQKVIEPRTQVILKETHKETVRPVKMASRSSVRYYQIQPDGQRVPITAGHVQGLVTSGAIGYNDIGVLGGATHAGAAGIVAGTAGMAQGVAQRIGQQRYGLNSGQALVHNSAAAGFPVQAGGQIGMINMQSGAVGGAPIGGIIGQAGAAQQAALHAEAAMLNGAAARQSAVIQHGGAFQHPSQYAGIFQNLNKNSNAHILAKVANAR